MIISIYFTIMSSFSCGIFAAYKDTKILSPTTIVATIISITFNILFINKIGLFAPVIGTMLAYFVLNLYRNYKLRKYIVLPKDKYMPYNIFVIGLLLIFYYQENILFHLLALFIGTGYTIYINKSFLKSIFDKRNFKFMTKFRRKA